MTQESEEQVDGKKAPLIEHLRELKNRLILSILALLVSFVVCYFYVEEIYQFLVRPLADLYEGQEGKRLIFTGLTEAFFTYVKLSFFAGFIVSFPIIAYQFYAFVSPGLYKKEKKATLPFLIISPVLFILGAGLVYYFIFPLAWQFFLGFEIAGTDGTMAIQLEARVSEYLSLVTGLILAFGLAFQLPVILILLAHAGFVTSKGLAAKRKYALVGIVTVAAIITPPDVISQIGLALPLLLLYEFSVFACKIIENKEVKKKEDA